MLGGILSRYFALRFMRGFLAIFISIFLLVALLDYIETMRHFSDNPKASILLMSKISVFRVPQVTDGLLPFCILIAAMSFYLDLSRRLELVIARSAGMSAWQFLMPAMVVAFMIGLIDTTIYNPIAAVLQERSKAYEAELTGNARTYPLSNEDAHWLSQKSEEGTAFINARSSRSQGVYLSGVTIFTLDSVGNFMKRIEATTATLEIGQWVLRDARIYSVGARPLYEPIYYLPTSLTRAQLGETFSTPETVPFWLLPRYIFMAEQSGNVAAGYKFQLQKLVARPFLLSAMVLLAAAVSLRHFRFGGIQKMILYGIALGFLIYLLLKVTSDLAQATIIFPIVAAWVPVLVAGLIGVTVLLFQEDG